MFINPGGPPVLKLQKTIGAEGLINREGLINPDLTYVFVGSYVYMYIYIHINLELV